ncbi:MAG TPA: phosphoribosyltransferase [Longimicrobiaceae bacterium]
MSGEPIFADRSDAGRRLAERLGRYAGRDDVVVLAVPRGGVPVGFEVARALGAPLDVLVVRKLGAPGNEELAMGAVAEGGIRVVNDEVVRTGRIPAWLIDEETRLEQTEMERREHDYRGHRPPPVLRGRTVLLVDDGIATGATIRAALAALRAQDPARIVVATPTAPASACEELRRDADEVVCLATPEPFYSIALSYEEFPQLSDEQVDTLLHRAVAPRAGAAAGA